LLVIDDRPLFEGVVESDDDAVGSFREAGDRGELYTTGYWYWRLPRAIGHPVGGALSDPFRRLPEEVQRRVTVAMTDLPASIGMLSLRRLVPIMAALPGQVNALTAEAVATAIAVDGTVVVTTESEMLRRVATAASVPVEVLRLAR
jgi:hypothetical protein